MTTHRHSGLDVLRGLVIVLMTLDHARGFIAPAGMSPENLDTTTLPFFMSRWVTHLCAPTFVFLMGVGVGLRRQRKPHDMSGYLLSRGLWIVFLEVTWITFAFYWSLSRTFLGVLWALGGSMVLLAAMTRLSGRVLLWAGLLMTLTLDLLGLKGTDISAIGFLFAPHSFQIAGHWVHAAYALVPWLAVAMIGVGVGPALSQAKPRQIAKAGACTLGIFVVLRSLQLGDPRAWSSHPRGTMFTTMDFINPSKYPPSMAFLALTLGAAMLILAGMMGRRGALSNWLAMLGRVPLFFYLLHLPLCHGLGNLWAWSMHGVGRVPAQTPLSMPVILGAWGLAILILWPACAAWRRLKDQRPDLRWLAYL